MIIKFCLVFPKIFLLHKVVRDAKKVEKHWTNEPMHLAQAQSVRVKEKNIFYLLVTIVATLQEVRINVYFILISKSGSYVLSYGSIYN